MAPLLRSVSLPAGVGGLKPFFTLIAVVILAIFAGLVLLRRHLTPRR
jgi:hypothetical protein